MGKLMCEICGGETLLKEGARFRCTGCGAYYSPEDLKGMLNAPVVEECVAVPPQEAPVPVEVHEEHNTEKVAPPRSKAKTKTIITIIVVAVIALGLLALIFGAIISSSGLVPQKAKAKELAEKAFDHRITNENITVGNLRFTSVTAIQFQTREEDCFGYFEDLELPVTVTDQNGNETKYKDYYTYYSEVFGTQFDPEADVKWAYTLAGTYDAFHTEHGDIQGEFTIICVQSGNSWRTTEIEFGASEETLREDVLNHLTAYLLLTYDIQPNPKIEITSIEKDQYDNYTIYGTVTVRDMYGDKYYGKFTAEYDYDSYDQYYEQDNLEVEELSRNPLLDIFN